MLKLNKGMMQFLKHPYHRNDLANLNRVYLRLYTGQNSLTQAELDYANSNLVTLSSGLFNNANMETNLKTTRTLVGYSALNNSTALSFFDTSDIKRTGSYADESSMAFSRKTESIYAAADGTASLFELVICGTAIASTTRTMLYGSVGLAGSGADLTISDNQLVTGERYRVSDFRFQLANLLGDV